MVGTGKDKIEAERKPYISKASFQLFMVGPGGFEPPTSTVSRS